MTPRSFFPLALLAPALALTACKSSQPKGMPKKLPNVSVSSSAAPPRHNMNRGEYPFDAQGNYITAWAAEGSRGGGNIPAPQPRESERQPTHSAPPPPSKPQRRGSESRMTSDEIDRMMASDTPQRTYGSTRMIVSNTQTSAPPPAPPPSRSTPSPTVRVTSTGSSTNSSTASRPAPKPAPKPKPKPAAPSVITHTVKSGDTLYGLALRYKSTVAKIKAASGISSDLLQIGQKLKIPR